MRPGCGFCPFSGVDGYCIRACRGRPMCRPVGGFREETCPGGHTGPPLRGVGSVQRSTEIGMKRRLVQRGGAEPAPYRGSGAGGCVQDGGVWSPRPTEATQVVPSGGPMYLRHGFRRPNFVPKFGASVMGIGPYEKESKPHQPPGPAAHSGAYAARSRGMSGNWSRDHSQRDHQRRTIPQSRLRLTAPFAQGSLGDVGIRPFYDGRGFGPPRSSAPTEGLPKSQQRADVGIGPYGTNGSPLRLPRQRLAKRKARKEKLVKFGLCPMSSECSTAQKVRRSQQGPARVPAEAASTE